MSKETIASDLFTEQARNRAKLVSMNRNPKNRLKASECGHYLASDQVAQALCSPCQTKRDPKDIPSHEAIAPQDKPGSARRGQKPGIYAANLLGLMEAKKMNPLEVARELGIQDPAMVRRHVSTERPAAIRTIKRYAKIFDVTVDEIIGDGKQRDLS